MGSKYKHTIFREEVKDKLNLWRKDAKRRVRKANSVAEHSRNESNTVANYSRRSSTDSDSADETGFDTINEGDPESRFERPPPTTPVRDFDLSQLDQSFLSLEISIENKNDGRPFMIPTSQAVSSITRTSSVPTVHFDTSFYKLFDEGLQSPLNNLHRFQSGPL